MVGLCVHLRRARCPELCAFTDGGLFGAGCWRDAESIKSTKELRSYAQQVRSPELRHVITT